VGILAHHHVAPGAAMDQITKGRRYLRKVGVADRYGMSIRQIERMVRGGALPKPIYLPGSRIPLWAEDALDENDRRAAMAAA
jgi:predicted DNA-binding transcriptional regulator AlpA